MVATAPVAASAPSTQMVATSEAAATAPAAASAPSNAMVATTPAVASAPSTSVPEASNVLVKNEQ